MIRLGRTQFLSALIAVAPALPKKTPKEILRNYRLHNVQGKLYLYATDHEMALSADLGAEYNSPVDILLPARVLQIVRESHCDEIALSYDAESGLLTIEAGSAAFKLNTESAHEFPSFDFKSDQSPIVIDADQFREAVKKTVFSIDEENYRYAMGGVLLDCQNNAIVSTDGSRLSIVELPLSGDYQCVIPSKTLKAVIAALNTEDEIHLTCGNNSCQIRTNEMTATCRLIEGRFPRWQDVVPDFSQWFTLQFDTKELLHATRQAIITTTEESLGLTLEFHESSLVISSQGAEIGKSTIKVSPQQVNAVRDSVAVMLKSEFLKQWLSVVADDSVSVSVSENNTSPVVFQSHANRYVLMPILKE